MSDRQSLGHMLTLTALAGGAGVAAETGRWVWLHDDAEGWLPARVLDATNPNELTIQLQNGQRHHHR
jgi:hypothetical protein